MVSVHTRIGNRDLPGGLVVKTSPSNAGGMASVSGWGPKIPHATWTHTHTHTHTHTIGKIFADSDQMSHKPLSNKLLVTPCSYMYNVLFVLERCYI